MILNSMLHSVHMLQPCYMAMLNMPAFIRSSLQCIKRFDMFQYGDTPLHTAARYGHAGVTRILLIAKCNINEQNQVSFCRKFKFINKFMLTRQLLVMILGSFIRGRKFFRSAGQGDLVVPPSLSDQCGVWAGGIVGLFFGNQWPTCVDFYKP